MKLIVGLGNPGKEYEHTRHNVGFMFISKVVQELNGKFSLSKQWKCEAAEMLIQNEKILFIKPQTFMNLSGEAVLLTKQFYKIDIKDILVIYDDLDLDTGRIRIRSHGSSGGHRGMQNIIDLLGTNEIKRVKIGISKVDSSKTIQHVLGEFSKEENRLLEQAIFKAKDIIMDFIQIPFEQVMNRYNGS